MAAGPGELPSQDIHPGRDALVAGRDFHYHAAAAEPQAPTSVGPVPVRDVPRQPPGFLSRAELLAALDASGPRGRRPDPPLERLNHAGPGPPADVEPRHAVAEPEAGVAAALGPADDRDERVPHRGEPGASLPCSPLDVSACPFARPRVFRPVETRVPCQSCHARSTESRTRSRRCSGVSTRNSPPNDHHACPPSDCSGSPSQGAARSALRRPPPRPRRARRVPLPPRSRLRRCLPSRSNAGWELRLAARPVAW